MASVNGRPEKAMQNESLIREVNERIEQLLADAENPEFLCECADLSCIQPLQLSVGEYEAIRSSPVRFVVAPDHKNPALERIVQENDRFSVVEKIGEEAATARGLAQRSEV